MGSILVQYLKSTLKSMKNTRMEFTCAHPNSIWAIVSGQTLKYIHTREFLSKQVYVYEIFKC